MRWNFPRPRGGSSRLLIWVPLYGALLAASCWLISSCSDGVVRADKDSPVAMATWTPPPGATLVGSEICAGCHDKEAKSFEKSHHGKKNDPRTPAAKQECETCHGPGSVHAQNGGGKGTILSFSKDSPATPAEKAGKCLECHEKTWPEWEHGKHAARGVACVDCHSMHASPDRADHMLKSAFEPEVCEQCHKHVYADLAKQSHHPVREGKVVCTDCHNPHGSTSDKNIKASTVNELCYKCHTEKRGPFMWEHPPVMEDCLNCHIPHGSIHDKLLNAERPFLCQRCHTGSRHPATLYDATALYPGFGPAPTGGLGPLPPVGQNTGAKVQAILNSCSNCHVNIHGSNHPSGMFFQR